MDLIRALARRSPLQFGLAILTSTIGGLMTIITLGVLFRVLATDANPQEHLFQFVAAALCVTATRWMSRFFLAQLGRRTAFQIHARLAEQIIAAPLRDLERIGGPKLVSAFTDEVGKIAATPPIIALLCTDISILMACLGYLGWLSPLRLLIIMSLVGLGGLLFYFLQAREMKFVDEAIKGRDDLVKIFRSLVSGAKEIKLNAARKQQVLEAFRDRSNQLFRASQAQSLYFNGSTTVTQSLFFLALGLAVFLPANGRTDRHLFTTYSVSVIYIVGTASGIRDLIRRLRDANQSVRRLNELDLRLELAYDTVTSDEAGNFSHLRAITSLSLSGVTADYTTKHADPQRPYFALGPIDLTLNAGEIVFVTGRNGSGKTTLAKVLLGLYTPTAGQIRLNETLVEDANRNWYCQHFSAIFSDFYLFDQLIQTDEGFHARHVAPLLDQFKIGHKVQVQTGGLLSTTTALSLGERKRLALTLARIEDKPICVFDEWAADQDPAFKEFFYRQFLRELKSRRKLVVAITHDDRYFHLADKVVVLDQAAPMQIRGNAPSGADNDLASLPP
ncbi:cyclic peptide export ABC transporter [Bradyrhizobium ontarionense]|uniref:Cyclic peptide export ABC transporter n=1 Tax=Bradyrhizobium ontarionense TaxID=2898149 RepID=A0ABY3R8E7_9BRAD|nr:cyclic peptide export ABC transporter [Bradyrhizobium sp. A19]UFZ03297.1 cyclic peptide export ABC transporter [Bradyrhizobium sp. A19]